MDETKNPWQTLSSEIKYDNKWIRVIENQVLNPTGNPGIYGVVHFKNSAIAVIPLDEDNYTWIVGQYRYTLNTYEWEVCEGGCPYGEDTLTAAKRELLEETGLIADSYELIMITELSNSVTDEMGYTYVAKGLKQVQNIPEETEQLQIRKLPFEEVFQMAMNGEIKDALSVASIFKVKLMLGKDL